MDERAHTQALEHTFTSTLKIVFPKFSITEAQVLWFQTKCCPSNTLVLEKNYLWVFHRHWDLILNVTHVPLDQVRSILPVLELLPLNCSRRMNSREQFTRCVNSRGGAIPMQAQWIKLDLMYRYTLLSVRLWKISDQRRNNLQLSTIRIRFSEKYA